MRFAIYGLEVLKIQLDGHGIERALSRVRRVEGGGGVAAALLAFFLPHLLFCRLHLHRHILQEQQNRLLGITVLVKQLQSEVNATTDTLCRTIGKCNS